MDVRLISRRLGLFWLGAWLVLAGSAPSFAEEKDWAKAMFNHTSHDFGVVARGSKMQHRFTLENIYEEDVHIAGVRSSCGCTKPTIDRRTLKTWEKTDIVAELDTRDHMGRKDATVTVVLDRPFPAEVQLRIHSYIRSDLVIQPEAVRFGCVTQGSAAERKLTVTYAGRDDFRIERVETQNPFLQAKLVPLPSSPGRAAYELQVSLSGEAQVGYLNEQLVLVTNDKGARSSRIPVAVEGEVRSTITVRPSSLMLGIVQPGATVSRQLVVRAAAPFEIVGATASDSRIKLSLPPGARAVQCVPVIFTAGATPEQVEGKIRIETTAPGGESLEVPVQVQVVEGW